MWCASVEEFAVHLLIMFSGSYPCELFFVCVGVCACAGFVLGASTDPGCTPLG